jgi:RNA polymerase primary sigma factor
MIFNSDIVMPLIKRTVDSTERVFAHHSEKRRQAALDSVQLLAMQMEQARFKLSRLLIKNQLAFNTLIEHYVCKLRAGVDSSDLVLTKGPEDDSVQVDLFGQVDSQERIHNAIGPDATINGSYHADDVSAFSTYHFLPAFLIEISTRVLKAMPVDSASNRTYKKLLLRRQQRLKNLRQQMIVTNTGLVVFVARKYKTNNLTFEDIMQEGLIGLIKAVDRFDYMRSVRFSTYALFWIKQAISRLIVKQEKIVRLPVSLAEKASTVIEAICISYAENERWPTLGELQERSNLSESEIKSIISYYQAIKPLDASLQADDDSITLMEQMKQQQFASPLDAVIDDALSDYLEQIMASLSEKEATVLIYRFGLKNHAEMTLQAIADQLQVTRERVRQIQNEALKKLKSRFGYDLKLFLEANDS